jgi:hypothetical protein
MLNIGKIRGAILSGVIILVYYYYWLPYWHRDWFGFEPEYGRGTGLVLLGLIMTQVVILQPGDTARLTFFGSLLNRTWGGSIALVPNVFHTTIVMFRFAILWGLAVLNNDTYKRYEEPNVRVNTSDANFKYQANVQMTYGQAQVSRATEVIMRLFLDYKRVPEEYYVASFGYRVLLVGIVMVCLNSTLNHAKIKLNATVASLSQAVTKQQKAPILNSTAHTSGNITGGLNSTFVEKREQLELGRKPSFPPPGNFVAQRENNAQFFTRVEGDDRKYYLFHEPNPGEIKTITVKESMCALIPPGRQIAFVTDWPPMNAENMENQIIYTKKYRSITRTELLNAWLAGKSLERGLSSLADWSFVNKNWHTVETFERRLVAQAKAQNQIRAYESGGIVCF